MQNRYVDDIGDYLKHPDESHNRDGRHIGYLERPERYRHYDTELFDALCHVVTSNRRNVQALEAAGVVARAIRQRVVPSRCAAIGTIGERDRWFSSGLDLFATERRRRDPP